MNRSDFVKTHIELITLEKNEEIDAQKVLLETLAMSTLQRKGICISKVKIVSYKTGMYGRCILKFEPTWTGKQLPSHSFSSGDIAGVWAVNNEGQRTVIESGVVTSCSNQFVKLAMEKPFEMLGVDQETTYSLVKLSNDVTYRRMKRALELLDKYRNGIVEKLIDVLFGIADPQNCSRNTEQNELVFINQNLNEPQKEAVKFALGQKEVAIIHGPPGTGKTTTVIEIILQSVKKKNKLLVCAPSNIAVDNLLERLSSHKLKSIRLGHPARMFPTIQQMSLDYILSRCDGSQVIMELRQEIDQIGINNAKKSKGEKKAAYRYREELKKLTADLKEREKNLLTQVLKNADVILSTLVGASNESPLKYLPLEHFDMVVVDECSQALEAACWIPLLKAPKCLLAGDHLQLPPTIFSKAAAEDGLAISLMERMVKLDKSKNSLESSVVKLLEIQYRMHKDIMKFSSSTLYEDKLVADESVASQLLKDLPEIEDNEITSVPLLLIDTAGCDMYELDVEEEDSKGNEGEADLVSIHIENLVKSGINPIDIAVIAPYNLQVELIRCRLSEKYPTLEIRSVDGFQGREKEVVVLTLVRSNKQGEVGFLAEDRRINVAITRAKRHFAVICDSVTVSHHSFLKSLIEYLNSHGEVHSANQYSHELQNVETTRPGYLKLKKAGETKKKTNNNKQKTLEPKKAEAKMNSQFVGEKKKKDSTPFLASNLPKNEISEEDQLKKDDYEKKISAFIYSEDQHMEFPTSFTSFDRMLVHEIAESFGLIHISEGEGEKRHIVLFKNVQDKESVPFPQELAKDEKNHKITSSVNLNKNNINTLKKVEEKMCKHCSKYIPINNYTLHNSHCRNIPRVTSKQISKPKQNVLESKNEDIDSILDNIIKVKDICSLSKCKTNVSLLGQICQFCKEKFCLSHHMAEIHGCGDEAKAQARSSIRKEMANCSKEVTKKLDSVKRVHVQRKLDKKLEELSSQRKAKKK